MAPRTSIVIALVVLSSVLVSSCTLVDAHRPVGTSSPEFTSTTPLAPMPTSTNTTRGRGDSQGNRTAIVAIYPNPVLKDDPGEFVVLSFPAPTNVTGWTITDDETIATFPNTTFAGRVVISTSPTTARRLVELPVYGLAGSLSLANDGETVVVRNGTRVVDSATFGRASPAEEWIPTSAGGRWTRLGRTTRPATHGGSATVRAFVLPDDPAVPFDALGSARRRILLAGYTFTSERAARHLRRAAREGVTVRLLLDGAPVGGISRREARILDSLTAAGVDVRVIGGPWARYDFHHAKYAVVDERALVLTENWKPAGVGGHSSRGWGVLVDDPTVANELAATFEADADWRDSIPWRTFRRGRTFTRKESANATYPSTFEPRTVRVDASTVLLAPDNAEDGTLDLLGAADSSVRIEQVSIGSHHQPFLRAAIDAASRGVEVRILLSQAWYVREENQRLVEWLNEKADRESLPLAARLAQPGRHFEKVHAKGVVVDRERVVVGSMNWNNHSARENREVLVVLEGTAVGDYYAQVFDADWAHGSSNGFPAGLLVTISIGVLVARVVTSERVTFE